MRSPHNVPSTINSQGPAVVESAVASLTYRTFYSDQAAQGNWIWLLSKIVDLPVVTCGSRVRMPRKRVLGSRLGAAYSDRALE
jgi:hypothetical protein